MRFPCPGAREWRGGDCLGCNIQTGEIDIRENEIMRKENETERKQENDFSIRRQRSMTLCFCCLQAPEVSA